MEEEKTEFLTNENQEEKIISLLDEAEELPNEEENEEQEIKEQQEKLNNLYFEDEEEEAEEYSEEEEASPEIQTSFKRDGEMLSFLSDKINAEICGFISGSASSLFKLSKEERAEFSEITGQYLQATNTKPGPEMLFYASIAAIFSPKWIKAAKARKQRTSKAAGKVTEAGPMFKTREDENIIFENPEPPQRGRFDIDKNGFYTYTNNSQYIKAGARREKAPDEIKEMLKAGYSNKQIKEMLIS